MNIIITSIKIGYSVNIPLAIYSKNFNATVPHTFLAGSRSNQPNITANTTGSTVK